MWRAGRERHRWVLRFERGQNMVGSLSPKPEQSARMQDNQNIFKMSWKKPLLTSPGRAWQSQRHYQLSLLPPDRRAEQVMMAHREELKQPDKRTSGLSSDSSSNGNGSVRPEQKPKAVPSFLWPQIKFVHGFLTFLEVFFFFFPFTGRLSAANLQPWESLPSLSPVTHSATESGRGLPNGRRGQQRCGCKQRLRPQNYTEPDPSHVWAGARRSPAPAAGAAAGRTPAIYRFKCNFRVFWHLNWFSSQQGGGGWRGTGTGALWEYVAAALRFTTE